MTAFIVGLTIGVGTGFAVVYLLGVKRDPPRVTVRMCAECGRIRPDVATVRGVHMCGDCA